MAMLDRENFGEPVDDIVLELVFVTDDVGVIVLETVDVLVCDVVAVEVLLFHAGNVVPDSVSVLDIELVTVDDDVPVDDTVVLEVPDIELVGELDAEDVALELAMGDDVAITGVTSATISTEPSPHLAALLPVGLTSPPI